MKSKWLVLVSVIYSFTGTLFAQNVVGSPVVYKSNFNTQKIDWGDWEKSGNSNDSESEKTKLLLPNIENVKIDVYSMGYTGSTAHLPLLLVLGEFEYQNKKYNFRIKDYSEKDNPELDESNTTLPDFLKTYHISLELDGYVLPNQIKGTYWRQRSIRLIAQNKNNKKDILYLTKWMIPYAHNFVAMNFSDFKSIADTIEKISSVDNEITGLKLEDFGTQAKKHTLSNGVLERRIFSTKVLKLPQFPKYELDVHLDIIDFDPDSPPNDGCRMTVYLNVREKPGKVATTKEEKYFNCANLGKSNDFEFGTSGNLKYIVNFKKTYTYFIPFLRFSEFFESNYLSSVELLLNGKYEKIFSEIPLQSSFLLKK